MRYLYLWLCLFSSLTWAETIWLNQDWDPVQSEAEATFYIKGPLIEQDGLWPVTAYYVGTETPRFIGTNNHPNVALAKSVGDYQYFYKNGQLEAKGKRNSKGQYEGPMYVYYQTGEKSAIYRHLAGRHHGKHEVFFKNGKPKRVFYMENDKHHGEDIHYYEKGGIRRSLVFVNGKMHGIERYYGEDGTLRHEQDYVDDKEHGMAVSFFGNGIKSYERPFHNGLLHGVVRYWKEDGQLSEETHYVDGKKDGESRSYDNEGRLRYLNHYKQDKQTGEQLTYYHNSEQLYQREIFDDQGRLTFQESFDKEGEKYREEVYRYHVDGQAIIDDKTFRSGKLVKLDQQDDAQKWRLITTFDQDTGELIQREETLDGELHNQQLFTIGREVVESTEYQHGKRHGEYSKKRKDGTVIKLGEYANDLPIGSWKAREQSTILTYHYNHEGKLEGEFKQVAIENGELIELAHYRNGELHGHYEYHISDKLIKEKGEYINGQRHGAWHKVIEMLPYELWIGEYQLDVVVGHWRTVSNFGYTLSRGQNDAKGNKQGTHYYFSESGLLTKIERYQHGKLVDSQLSPRSKQAVSIVEHSL